MTFSIHTLEHVNPDLKCSVSVEHVFQFRLIFSIQALNFQSCLRVFNLDLDKSPHKEALVSFSLEIFSLA